MIIMSKIYFNPNEEGGLELARTIVLERLRKDKDWVTTQISLAIDFRQG